MSRPLAVLALAVLPGAAVGQLRTPPVDIRVPVAPQAMAADGQQLFVYELRITNVARGDRALTGLRVMAGDQEVAAWHGDALRPIMVRVGGDAAGDSRVIGGGRQGLVYVAVSVAPGRAVTALRHQLTLTHPDSLAAPPRDTVHAFEVAVDRRAVPTLAAPFRGGPWLAANGPGNTSGHRRTAIPIAGQARIAQRFASDWVKFGPEGTLWRGDSTKNENWFGYREPLLAVANGRVVATKDSIPENVALSPSRAVPITLETVGGNYVILDIGEGRYAFYAHLVPGSLRVRVGEKVKAGDVVGLLGNSGNSDAPHLHLQVGDAASPLGSEGLPFVFERFDYLGKATSLLGRWTPTGPAEGRRRSAPLEHHVVRF